MVIDLQNLVLGVTAVIASLIGASMIVAPAAWAQMRHESPDRVDRPLAPRAHSYRTQLRIVGVALIAMGLLLLVPSSSFRNPRSAVHLMRESLGNSGRPSSIGRAVIL